MGIIGSALVWGSSVYYLLPESEIHAMLVIIIVGGMVAGGVGSSSYRPESYIFYNITREYLFNYDCYNTCLLYEYDGFYLWKLYGTINRTFSK